MAAPELERAVVELRAGNAQAARRILTAYLQSYPEEEYGWLLLSFAVTEHSKKVDCLKRALSINPNNVKARQRLAELTKSEDAPEQPRGRLRRLAREGSVEGAPPARPAAARTAETSLRREVAAPERGTGRWWIRPLVIAGLLILGCALVATGYWAYTVLQDAQIFQDQAAATSRAEVAAAIATQGGSLDLPATWTPSVTPTRTLTPTITPTRTPTPTATLVPPNATAAAQMEVIQVEVADLRGLPIKSDVTRYLVTRLRVREILERSFLENGGSREEVEDQAIALTALGLIKPTYDLFTNVLNGLSDNVGGFYFPWGKETFIIGSRFGGIERWVYSHEYGHALVDQHFDLAGMGVYPVCLSNEDRCTAIQALVEGDATLLMTQWWFQYASPRDYEDILNYNPPAYTLPEQFPPPYVQLDSAFPYSQGLEFVAFLHDRGNWAGVNDAYSRLPESTEQILHPLKYLSGEAPVAVVPPQHESVLAGDWRRVISDRLGEWKTYLLLGYGADLAAQLDDSTAQVAADGWGGDSYQVYYNEALDQIALVAEWAWDTQTDANSFAAAMLDYQAARFRGGSVAHPAGDCWESNEQVSCIFTSGSRTLWLLAPDQAILNSLLVLYPDFR